MISSWLEYEAGKRRGLMVAAALATGVACSSAEPAGTTPGTSPSSGGGTNSPTPNGGGGLGGATPSGGVAGELTGGLTSGGAATGGPSTAGAATGGVGPWTGGVSGAGRGGNGVTDGVGSLPKRGLAFSTTKGECEDLALLGVDWFYNWRQGNPCRGSGAEFVPMVWGSWKKLSWAGTPQQAADAGYRTILGFNEPDRPDQSNLTVEEALELWQDFMIDGVRIGSPAVVNRAWLEAFMTGVEQRKLRVDFITLHWYGFQETHCNDTSRLANLLSWAEQFGRPIWITEWSCRNHSAEVTEAFLRSALELFRRHPSVERFSWYLSRSDGGFGQAKLVSDANALTPLGTVYSTRP